MENSFHVLAIHHQNRIAQFHFIMLILKHTSPNDPVQIHCLGVKEEVAPDEERWILDNERIVSEYDLPWHDRTHLLSKLKV